MKIDKNFEPDIFGIMYYDYYFHNERLFYQIERDDGFLSTNEVDFYFREKKEWPELEKSVLEFASGKILDIGAGAGRHCLHYQNLGHYILGLDTSPLSIETMKERGVKNTFCGELFDLEVDNLFFDTVLMMFNGFGLGRNPDKTKQMLKKLYDITSDRAKIIFTGTNPNITNDEKHIAYNKMKREQGYAGQVKLRVKYQQLYGPWFYLYFTPPDFIDKILSNTGWRIQKILKPKANTFGAILRKNY